MTGKNTPSGQQPKWGRVRQPQGEQLESSKLSLLVFSCVDSVDREMGRWGDQ